MKRFIKSLLPQRLLDARDRKYMLALADASGLSISFRQDLTELSRGLSVLRLSAHHKIYLPHMIESFDYYFDSVIPIQIGGRSIVDLSGPRYHRLVGLEELPLLFPSHTEPYVTTSQYLEFAGLSEGKIVLDIGAYAAVTSIIFGRLVGASGEVFAFEADRKNVPCAAENIRLASRWLGVHNISLVEAAMWSHTEGLDFSSEGTMGSSAISVVGRGRGPAVRVPSTTIEDFCSTRGIHRVDFIKMDIEGAEIEVLSASRDILSHLRPRLIIEPHDVGGSLSTERCRHILASCGYTTRLTEQFGSSTPLIEATHAMA